MIRLSRIGKKNYPTYRIVVSDKQKDTKAPYLEALGHYNPNTHPSTFEVDKERLFYWLGVGAQMSDTLHNLCVASKLIEGKKRDMMHKEKKSEETAEAGAQPQTPQTPQADEKAAEVPKAEKPKEKKPETQKPEKVEEKK